MVMEIAGHGDLLEYVKLRGAIPEEKAKVMFGQLVSAVDYMHTLNIVHRWGRLYSHKMVQAKWCLYQLHISSL